MKYSLQIKLLFLTIIAIIAIVVILKPKAPTFAPLYFDEMTALRKNAVNIPARGIYTFTQAMYKDGYAQDYTLYFKDGKLIEHTAIGTKVKM